MKHFIIMSLLLFAPNVFAQNKTELKVYTYKSFIGKWGPGQDIAQAFQKTCNCTIKWETVEDANSLLIRAKSEANNLKADVILGLDNNLMTESQKTGLFLPYNSPKMKDTFIPQNWPINFEFTPIDYGYFSFIYDSEKIKNPPKSMTDLLNNKEFDKKVLIQDPRTSAVGLGLLLWIKAIYKNNSTDALKKLSQKTLTVSKSWSDAYGLFTKGEAPFVLSYITSEIYHKDIEKTSRYKASLFSEGHYMQIELASIVKHSKQINLAKQFIDFLLSPESQKVIAEKNSMMPVLKTNLIKNLSKTFLSLPVPINTYMIKSNDVDFNKKQWLIDWQTSFE